MLTTDTDCGGWMERKLSCHVMSFSIKTKVPPYLMMIQSFVYKITGKIMVLTRM
jgi:hypothetical protein